MSWAKRKWRWALAGGMLLSAFAVASIAFGLFDSGSTSDQGAGPIAADTDGVGEGIQVHGDWVIEVRNADGSVAERRDFENALTTAGARVLANTLARQFYAGAWSINLVGNPTPCLVGAATSPCTVHESVRTPWPTSGDQQFPNLSVTTDPAPCCSGTTLVLTGNFNAAQDGNISLVSAQHCFSLPANTDPSTCNNTQAFTVANLAAPVSVTTGQQVLVTVRISFS